ncbi:U6 snRNA-specific terminal uridylyltransferase 1, putative [Theobroma cacao]|uniref:U6 snRNA-specific terminal uridylyltransferase 1, putative n=1 Tax=Theobroma cacao TaxID=3641 RepID=A0A061DJB8_THECC|nr:U6 snRNA-specific terminal uridylyltransferase 1, putative [Theobroma cacao]
MTFSAKVLLKKAKKLEVLGFEKNKIALTCASDLDQLLNEVYISRLPKQIDYDNRTDLVRIFNAMVKEIYGNPNGSPVVEGFGSFVMGIFSRESDLDLSINFRDSAAKMPKEKKIQTLHKLAQKLYSIQRGGHVSGIQTIMTARVPIVKVIDRGTGIECDVSVENRDGMVKSLIIRAISTIDDRFQKLSFLMKAWAKAHDINSSKERTLNSLSLISLVAFHLQTRNPPILPPFSALLKDGSDPAAVMKIVQNYLNYGKRNTESLAELYGTLLIKLASVEKLWQKGLCVSLCEGSWISKAWGSRICSMSVEDFTDQSQNVARAVGTEGFGKIRGCIRRSLFYLKAFSDGQMQGTKLKELLFGGDTLCSVGDSVASNLDKSTTKLSVPNDSNQIKRMKLTENLGAKNQSKTEVVVHHGTHQTKKRHFTGDLDKSKGAKRAKGPQLSDRMVGVQFMEGGRREWNNFSENRGHLTTHFAAQVPYLNPLSHSLDSLRCHGPVMLPSSAPNFTSFQGIAPPLVPLLNSLGLNVSQGIAPPLVPLLISLGCRLCPSLEIKSLHFIDEFGLSNDGLSFVCLIECAIKL